MTTVSWQMLKSPRVPIYGNLTLNVTSAGNDATGDYTGKPFQQLQAALDYIASALDFRKQSIVTINVGAGTFSGATFSTVVSGLKYIAVNGAGATTNLAYFLSSSPVKVLIGGVTFNGVEANTGSLASGGGGANISCSGTVWFNAQSTRPAIYAGLGGMVNLNNATINFNAGTYSSLFNAEASGYIGASSAKVTFTATCTVGTYGAAVVSQNGSIYFTGCTWTGTVTGAKYYAAFGGAINGGSTIPSTVVGSTANGGSAS